MKYILTFKKFIKRNGYKGLIRLLLAPLTVIVTTPFRMCQLLWNCRVLLDGNWSHYHRFSGIPSANCFYYWNQAFQLDEYGRSGISPLIGTGNYSLKKWFHLSLPSHYLFWRMSNVTTLVSFFGWAFSHVIWMSYIDAWFIILIIIIASLGSLLYSCIDRVNYNSIGWLFFPMALYGLYSNNFWITVFAGLMASFGSITVSVYIGISSIVFALHHLSMIPLVAMFPMGLKILSQLVSAVGTDRQIFNNVANLIGLSRKGVKYKRSVKLGVSNIYFVALFGVYIALSFYLAQGQTLIFLYVASLMVFLYVLNESSLFRFADTHSFYLSIWSVITANTIIFQDIYILAAYLFVSNPVPLFGLFFDDKKIIDVVPERQPIYVKNYVNAVAGLFKNVPPGSKVLFAFNDPGTEYDKIFDGYRQIHEVALYVAARKKIHLFPDWYAVSENNYPGAPSLWGRDVNSVLRNAQEREASHVIVYDTSEDVVSPIFIESDLFACVGELDWASIAGEFPVGYPYGTKNRAKTPIWYIFEMTRS